MLSGIKTGKRKRRPPVVPQPQQSSTHNDDAGACKQTALSSSSSSAAKGSGSSDHNRSAADALRMSLLVGGSGVASTKSSPPSSNNSNDDDVQSKLNSRALSYKNNESTIHSLQSRGRISSTSITTSFKQEEEDTIVINNPDGSSSSSKLSTIEYEKEHNIRYNSRGKLSNHAHTQLRQKTEREMTIEEMAAQEKKHSNNNNMDEVYARNVIKMGKSYNKLDAIMGRVDKSGIDEEDYGQETKLLSNLYTSNGDDKLSPAKLAARSQSKQIAHHDAITKITNKSWYWLESSKFDKRYLIALGDKVSLVMTPSHKRLQQQHSSSSKKNVWNGGQCYIVPLSYAESFVSLDEDTWMEVQRFQSSLKQMFNKDGRGVIFLETVTRTSGNKGMGYQARMEVVPVPKSVERDAPLYFKSALAEVAQEWGTHGLKPIVLGGQSNKNLRSAVPKIGFPYFYCGWSGGGYGGSSNNIIDEGFVQLIENEDDGDDYGDDNNDGGFGGGGGLRAGGGSKKFPRDFGLDTIGGMMDCDPMRFQRKSPSHDGDRAEILQFCERWKEFDWTLELDG